MACYHPWRLQQRRGDVPQVLPCGQCRGCRASHAREWAMRCMHEAALYDRNCFLTLTYDDRHLPPGGSLDGPTKDKPGAFSFFMKRLRKQIEPQRVRYFHVGEYGESTNRPHYHALLFGFDPADKVLLSVREGFPVFTSARMREAWPYGLHEIGSVTVQSAAYVARYVKKKMTGSWSKAKYGDREPEYGTMSRNPGIGAAWIDRYKCEVFPADSVVVRGREFKPPRYYAERVSRCNPALIEEVKWRRFQARRREDEGPQRLAAAEAVHIARDDLSNRGGGL